MLFIGIMISKLINLVCISESMTSLWRSMRSMCQRPHTPRQWTLSSRLVPGLCWYVLNCYWEPWCNYLAFSNSQVRLVWNCSYKESAISCIFIPLQCQPSGLTNVGLESHSLSPKKIFVFTQDLRILMLWHPSTPTFVNSMIIESHRIKTFLRQKILAFIKNILS